MSKNLKTGHHFSSLAAWLTSAVVFRVIVLHAHMLLSLFLRVLQCSSPTPGLHVQLRSPRTDTLDPMTVFPPPSFWSGALRRGLHQHAGPCIGPRATFVGGRPCAATQRSWGRLPQRLRPGRRQHCHRARQGGDWCAPRQRRFRRQQLGAGELASGRVFRVAVPRSPLGGEEARCCRCRCLCRRRRRRARGRSS